MFNKLYCLIFGHSPNLYTNEDSAFMKCRVCDCYLDNVDTTKKVDSLSIFCRLRKPVDRLEPQSTAEVFEAQQNVDYKWNKEGRPNGPNQAGN